MNGSKSQENSPKADNSPGTMAQIKAKTIASPKIVSRFSPINTLVNRGGNLTVNTGAMGALKKYSHNIHEQNDQQMAQ